MSSNPSFYKVARMALTKLAKTQLTAKNISLHLT